MFQIVADLVDVGLYAADALLGGLDVETGDLADRFLHQLGDVGRSDFAAQQVLILLHPRLDVGELLLPRRSVVLEYAVNLLLEEYLLE